MKVIAFNGSARKDGNTAILIRYVLSELEGEGIDTELFQSWGLGLRYVSPIGPLRLDVGFPLDRRPEDPEYTFYFGFGNVF